MNKIEQDSITVTLSKDEALILFDWISRLNETDHPEVFADNAEKLVLFNLEALLEKMLVEPFDANYAQIVADARERIRNS
ncbi:MAG: hypothetical protein HY080_01215 [Gammaproteobacteria bacterium]|nr:hypothetical protein [Gammaproteobacteria bacterium]